MNNHCVGSLESGSGRPFGYLSAAGALRVPVLLLAGAENDAREFPDEIAACREEGRRPLEEIARVVPNHSSKDRRTLPGWVALRASEGKDHSGILFYDDERFPAPAIRTLAKAIVRAGQERRSWRNAWVTLR